MCLAGNADLYAHIVIVECTGGSHYLEVSVRQWLSAAGGRWPFVVCSVDVRLRGVYLGPYIAFHVAAAWRMRAATRARRGGSVTVDLLALQPRTQYDIPQSTTSESLNGTHIHARSHTLARTHVQMHARTRCVATCGLEYVLAHSTAAVMHASPRSQVPCACWAGHPHLVLVLEAAVPAVEHSSWAHSISAQAIKT